MFYIVIIGIVALIILWFQDHWREIGAVVLAISLVFVLGRTLLAIFESIVIVSGIGVPAIIVTFVVSTVLAVVCAPVGANYYEKYYRRATYILISVSFILLNLSSAVSLSMSNFPSYIRILSIILYPIVVAILILPFPSIAMSAFFRRDSMLFIASIKGKIEQCISNSDLPLTTIDLQEKIGCVPERIAFVEEILSRMIKANRVVKCNNLYFGSDKFNDLANKIEIYLKGHRGKDDKAIEHDVTGTNTKVHYIPVVLGKLMSKGVVVKHDTGRGVENKNAATNYYYEHKDGAPIKSTEIDID
ncbi:hypothetical protein FACS1894167_14010 [Synergistales bacterium]|nr:hypothetical protein FACS1894167_14010 [Synergistales bacterium]